MYLVSFPSVLHILHLVLYTMFLVLQTIFPSAPSQGRQSALLHCSSPQGSGLVRICWTCCPFLSTSLTLLRLNLLSSYSCFLKVSINLPPLVLFTNRTALGLLSGLSSCAPCGLPLPAPLVPCFTLTLFGFCLYQLVFPTNFLLLLSSSVSPEFLWVWSLLYHFVL